MARKRSSDGNGYLSIYGAMVILARAESSSNKCLDLNFLVLIYTLLTILKKNAVEFC